MQTREILVSDYDSWISTNYDLPSALYFYYLNPSMTDFTDNDISILGNCSAIQSIQYVPFIEEKDLGLVKVPYDVERFGKIANDTPTLSENANVFRIQGHGNRVKKVGSFTPYKYVPNLQIGAEFDYRKESRLYNYPYSFAMLTDGLNPPMEVKYHLCFDRISDIYVRNSLSDRCSYSLFIKNYKGDVNGNLEGLVSSDAHEIPCSSSAYNQWYASNKNQTSQAIKMASQNAFMSNKFAKQQLIPNMVGSGIGAIGSLLSGNVMGLALSGTHGYSSYLNYNQQTQRNNLDVQQAIQSKMALESDLKSTPNTIVSMGSDVYYGLENGGKNITLFRFTLDVDYLERLGRYFAMFGYKQNKVMDINIRNRYYYNYIKTVNCNIIGENVPREHLEELKGIFDNGTTIWHYDREGVIVGDYTKDNVEYYN